MNKLSPILLLLALSSSAPATERVFLRILVAPGEEEMAAAMQELRSGDSFSEVAERRSVDDSSHLGGYLGSVHLSQRNPRFREAALALKPGDYGEPFLVEGRRLLLYRMPEDFRRRAYRLQDEGDRLRGQGRLDEAMQRYQAAIRTHPGLAQAHLSLGLAYGEAGKRELEEQSYRQAIRAAPGFHQAYHNLGALLWTRGDARGALEAFRRALQIKPDLFKAHVNLSTIHRNRGEIDAAIASARQALRLNPMLAGGYYALGAALHAQGDYEAAAEPFVTAATLKPKEPGFALTAAVAEANAGRKRQAIERLEALLAAHPEFRQARQMLRRLEGEQ